MANMKCKDILGNLGLSELKAFGQNWFKLPSGHIVQFGVCAAAPGPREAWPITYYPIPFPNAVLCPPVTIHSGAGAGATDANFIVDTMGSLTAFRTGSNLISAVNGSYIVIGW